MIRDIPVRGPVFMSQIPDSKGKGVDSGGSGSKPEGPEAARDAPDRGPAAGKHVPGSVLCPGFPSANPGASGRSRKPEKAGRTGYPGKAFTPACASGPYSCCKPPCTRMGLSVVSK